MRIIKEGKKPAKEIEITCDRCGCVFTYNEKDISSTRLYNESHYWVTCPTCGSMIVVKPFIGY